MKSILDHITPNIKALIFDLDGTLADTLPFHYEAWKLAGKKMGFHITDEMIDEHSGTPTKIVADILGEQYGWKVDSVEVMETKMVFYKELKAKQGKIKPITPILEIARDYFGKLPMTVGTGSTRKGALQSLSDIGATDLFDIIVTASDVDNPKPHPETFLRGAEHVGVSPEHCLVFEDGEAGIKAAKAGGFNLVDVKDYL